MLNRSWLLTFRTLVETGHFTQTATQLFMTQPGVSQHIKKLEEACGHDLITRYKKKFEVTEQGRMVYLHAKNIEKQELQLKEEMGFDDPYSGVCRIACSGALALQIYPAFLSLQAQHPKLICNLESAPNYKILNDIQQGNTDIGIVTEQPNTQLFYTTPLGYDELCLVLPSEVEQERVDDWPKQLGELGLVNHPDAYHYASLYFSQCGLPEVEMINIKNIPVVSYVNQLSQILQPIAQGIGFTVLPKSAVLHFPNTNELQVIHSPKKVVETLLLVTTSHKKLPKRYTTFLKMLETIL